MSWGAHAFFDWKWHHSIVITPSVITILEGNMFVAEPDILPVNRIERFTTRQNLMERILGYADLSIVTESATSTVGDNKLDLNDIGSASYLEALFRYVQTTKPEDVEESLRHAKRLRPWAFDTRQSICVPVIRWGIGLFMPFTVAVLLLVLMTGVSGLLLLIVLLAIIDIVAIIFFP